MVGIVDTDHEELESGKSFFRPEDKENTFALIAAVLNASNEIEVDRKVLEIEKILSPFQEQPQLLSPHMADLLEPLCSALLVIAVSEEIFTNPVINSQLCNEYIYRYANCTACAGFCNFYAAFVDTSK